MQTAGSLCLCASQFPRLPERTFPRRRHSPAPWVWHCLPPTISGLAALLTPTLCCPRCNWSPFNIFFLVGIILILFCLHNPDCYHLTNYPHIFLQTANGRDKTAAGLCDFCLSNYCNYLKNGLKLYGVMNLIMSLQQCLALHAACKRASLWAALGTAHAFKGRLCTPRAGCAHPWAHTVRFCQGLRQDGWPHLSPGARGAQLASILLLFLLLLRQSARGWLSGGAGKPVPPEPQPVATCSKRSEEHLPSLCSAWELACFFMLTERCVNPVSSWEGILCSTDGSKPSNTMNFSLVHKETPRPQGLLPASCAQMFPAGSADDYMWDFRAVLLTNI